MEEKKETKVRTSITMSPEVLDDLRKHAEVRGTSVSCLIEEACRAQLSLTKSEEVLSNPLAG